MHPITLTRTEDADGRLLFTSAADPVRMLTGQAHTALDRLGVAHDASGREAVKRLRDAGIALPREAIRVAVRERQQGLRTPQGDLTTTPVGDLTESAPWTAGAPLRLVTDAECAEAERRTTAHSEAITAPQGETLRRAPTAHSRTPSAPVTAARAPRSRPPIGDGAPAREHTPTVQEAEIHTTTRTGTKPAPAVFTPGPGMTAEQARLLTQIYAKAQAEKDES